MKMQTHVANLLGRDDGVSAWNSMLKHFKVTNDTLLSKDQSLYENFLVKWDSNVDNVLDWIDERKNKRYQTSSKNDRQSAQS